MKVRNLGGHFRCSICNTVSMEEIATNIGDYKSNMSFVNDPKDPNQYICIDCSDVIDEQRLDYFYKDDENVPF